MDLASAPREDRQSRATRTRAPSAAGIRLYHLCDGLTGLLIYGLVVFTPWAFGTTQPWSIRAMNIGGYALGLLLGVKLVIRWFQRYRPCRWNEGPRSGAAARLAAGMLTENRLTITLVALTVVILAYCLLSAVNARASFQNESMTFEYRDCIRWLPHSLDAGGTWLAFWSYLGLAGVFWSVRDWLLGKADGEERVQWQRGGPAGALAGAQGANEPARGSGSGSSNPNAPMPARLRNLLWLLALNGALLGLEGIIQRAADSPNLLFLVKPRLHQAAELQFGPYAYRSNAAQYFNLVWPVCLGFWWTLNRTTARKNNLHHILLVCAATMAACPIVSTSRGGALVTVGIGGLAAIFFASGQLIFRGGRRESTRRWTLTLVALSLFFTSALGLGFALGWKQLKPRMDSVNEGLAGREQLYTAARQMADDYPWFGTGPGTFETVSQLYPRPDVFWPAQLHNDWLETWITFGRLGSALVGLALGVVLLRWFIRGGIHGGRRFVGLTWLALGGCLAHARFDFPFQVSSILFLTVILCAVLFVLSRRV